MMSSFIYFHIGLGNIFIFVVFLSCLLIRFSKTENIYSLKPIFLLQFVRMFHNAPMLPYSRTNSNFIISILLYIFNIYYYFLTYTLYFFLKRKIILLNPKQISTIPQETKVAISSSGGGSYELQC